MSAKIDLTGQQFGRLTVIHEVAERRGTSVCWLCRCECGETSVVSSWHLRTGDTKSCGCLYLKNLGMTGSPEERTWMLMIQRCTNPNRPDFPRYGGRGIAVCERWNDFAAFYEDMGDRPEGYQLDRIDNDGPYSPDNCRWVKPRRQARNRRSNHRITFDGRTMCLAEWAEEIGISPKTLQNRLATGWSVERALTESVQRNGGL